MRITGGEARGRVIPSPAGLQVRPTGSKIRQALFNILGPATINGARFLDLFSGSGLVGLEALSRGAGSLVCVEEDKAMARAIEASLKHLNYEAEVIQADVRRVLPVLGEDSFDIVFADPPYKSQVHAGVLSLLDRYKNVRQGGLIIVEHMKGYALADKIGCIERTSTREYGQTGLTFYKRG